MSNKTRYKNKVVIGVRPDGTKVKKWASGSTKKELQENLLKITEKYRDGTDPEGANVFAMDFIYSYFDTFIAPNQKPQTSKDIRRQIKLYIEPQLKDKLLRAVTVFDLQECINGMNGKCRTLISNVANVLKRCFSSACAQGYIPRDISAGLVVRLPQREHNRALTDEERHAIESAIGRRDTEPLLLGVLYYTGMRRGEVLGLQWRDVDLDEGVIHVRRDFDFKTNAIDTLKTKNAERDIPIVHQLEALLREYRGIGEAFVVSSPKDPGKPLCEATLKRKWKKIRALVGDDVTTRTFRNNFATVLYDAGIDVLTASAAMGHADPSTTLAIYTDLKRSRKVKDGNETIKGIFSR
jgi:integrase